MDRKEFLKICSWGCLGVAGMSLLLQGCAGTKYFDTPIVGEGLALPLTAFEKNKNGQTTYLHYVVAQNEKLQYPVCVYRFSNTEYSALLMRCSHQGAELQVFGDRLQCPAHGSEFSNKGEVQNGPADTPLRVLPVKIENNVLNISLKL